MASRTRCRFLLHLPRFRCRPADRRAHRGDVAQQEVEVVAAPDWDGLGRLSRDVAGVAARRDTARCRGSGGASSLRSRRMQALLQLLMLTGRVRRLQVEVRSSSMERTAWNLLLSRSWCVSLASAPRRHVAAAPDSDVAGRSRDGLARWLLLRYVERRGGRAVGPHSTRATRRPCLRLLPPPLQIIDLYQLPAASCSSASPGHRAIP